MLPSSITENMKCPHCGHAMNHHADKLLQENGDGGGSGAQLIELHTCPQCGTNASRAVPWG